MQQSADHPSFQDVKVSPIKQLPTSAVSSDRPFSATQISSYQPVQLALTVPFLPPDGPTSQTDPNQAPVLEEVLPTTSAASASTDQDTDSDLEMAI